MEYSATQLAVAGEIKHTSDLLAIFRFSVNRTQCPYGNSPDTMAA